MTARPEIDWGRVLTNAYRPEAYGARGDGTVNDQAAVQSAVNAAAAAKATCLINGVYRCDSQIIMPSNTAILFTNPNAALVKNYSAGNNYANSFLISKNSIVSPTGATITNGSAVITNLSSTTGIVTNDLVTGPGIDAGSLVLSVDSPSQITMTKNAVAASSGSTINCSTKANDIRITGPGSIYASSTSMIGIIIGIYGDRFTFEDFQITCWAKSDAISGAGDQWRGRKVRMTGSDGQIGTTGLRYQGGDSSVFSFLHIESGDDALQMVPSGSAGSALFNQSITRCTYIGCTGSSVQARFMAVLNKAAAGPGGMSNSITDSQFIACRGFGNTRAIFVLNRDSSGDIDGITFQDCSVDTSGSQNQTFTGTTVANTGGGGVAQVTNLDTSQLNIGLTVSGTGIPGGTTVASIDTGNQITLSATATVTGTNQTITFGGYGQTVLANRSAGSGGVLYYSGVGNVKNIYFRRLTVKNPVGTNTTLGTAGLGLQNIYVEDCTLPASPNATASVVNIIQTTTTRVLGGQIDCGGYALTGVVFGGASNANTHSQIDGTRIIGIANTKFGVSFNNSAGGRMTGVRTEQFSGQTTAKTWTTGASSTGIQIHDNDFSAMTTTPGFTDSASGTIVYNNLGDTTAKWSIAVSRSYITGRWHRPHLSQGTTALTSATVSKLMAVPVPVEWFGRTCTGLGINMTVNATLNTAASATVRLALANDNGGLPATSIISGTELTFDATAVAQVFSGTFTGVALPANAWMLFVVTTPTGGGSLGTLTQYPTFNTIAGSLDGTASATLTNAPINGYNETGQTTLVALSGATLPTVNSGNANSPYIGAQLT